MVSNTNEYAQIMVSKDITLNEDQIKSFVRLDGDNVENKRVVETIILDDNNESSHSEGEVTICDTCGNIGYEDSLVTCCNCKVGAEHTYCMMEKVDKIPNNWSCYDCTDEVDGIQKEQKTEETISRKRKAESVTNVFKLTEKRSPQRRSNFLNNEIADFDLNVDLNIELGEMLHLLRQDLQVTSNLSV